MSRRPRRPGRCSANTARSSNAKPWGDALPAGQRTDFARAVALEEGETVVFSWVLWPDRATADACMAAMETDERFQQLAMPFDGSRMIYGGFATVMDERA